MIGCLWTSYDDIIDHKVNWDKATWDTFQRMMLVIDSGAHLDFKFHKQRLWHLSQAFAFAAMFVCGVIFYQTHAWLFSAVFGGIATYALYQWRMRWRKRVVREEPDPYKDRVWPFKSPWEIRQTLRRTPGFTKMRHRPEIEVRCIRSPWVEKVMLLPWIVLGIWISPIILFFQCMPIPASETRVELTTGL